VFEIKQHNFEEISNGIISFQTFKKHSLVIKFTQMDNTAEEFSDVRLGLVCGVHPQRLMGNSISNAPPHKSEHPVTLVLPSVCVWRRSQVVKCPYKKPRK
jgi:hypothetical protein